jgi:FMN phosphatase YigB (HAD superfamily)|tara:strand:- start:145 stop:864 length:720 start_codon:yes stop_codon:yes gene_type:complete
MPGSDMIRAILFDFTQTLVDSSSGFRLAEKRVKRNLFSYLGLTDWDEFLHKYRQIRSESTSRSIFSRKTIWQEVCWFFCSIGDEIKLKEWEDEYWVTVDHNTRLFSETLTVIMELSKTYKLGIISNTQGRVGELRNHGLDGFKIIEPYFQSVIIAGENSIPAKPKHQPFELCLNQLDIEAHESVYVGDDWKNDICGSMKAGLQPVWLKHHSINRNWPEGEFSGPTITSLDKLLDLALFN